MTSAITGGSGRGRRLEPDARRGQILECAVRLFGERPYAAVSTSDIAAAAGVARGLLNHYFGTKRDLYLEVVRRLVSVPADPPVPAAGPLEQRVAACVDWFLDTVAGHAPAFVAVTGAEGVGDDPQIEQILQDADDAAARAVLTALGVDAATEAAVAAVRAYGGLVKAAIREWVRAGALARDQVRVLLSAVLLTVVADVLPELTRSPTNGPTR